MSWALVFVGGFIGVLGLVGVVRPAALLGWIRGMSAKGRWIGGFSSRLVLGATCLLAAPVSRQPHLVRFIGWLALVAAFAILLAGPRRLDVFVQWWLERIVGRTLVLALFAFALAVALGSFLVYAAW